MPLPRSPLVRYLLLAVGVISLYALLHTSYMGYAPGITPRANACFTVLARNHDWRALRESMRQIEDRFNRRYNYPYVFLNDQPFSAEFINMTRSMTRAEVHYGQIPAEHWSYPEWIDKDKAARRRNEMHEKGVMYGDSESYRHMCRFESGLFFKHPLMQQFDYYWRLEPGIEYKCDINYDPFVYMKKNKIRYAWTIAIYELMDTIPTLWDSVKKFMSAHPDLIPESNSLWWVSRDNGTTYNGCHFWSNFEIADLSFYRSKEYETFFNYLDREGGFFYERWGDAPVHSIAAALFLQKEEVHWFKDIGYYHPGWQHCPSGDAWLANRCTCDPQDKSKTITNANWGQCSHQWQLLPDTPPGIRKDLL
ncbi:alpha 1,2-mannosyltransferase 2.4.1 [Coemansia erecta]|nr:alpha 1,2-mannosyltransferase 2.4.1 [Coemansia erecta]